MLPSWVTLRSPPPYNALLLAQAPTLLERKAANLFWRKQGQSIEKKEIWQALQVKPHSISYTINKLKKKLQPTWRIALITRTRYILLREGQDYVPEFADELLTRRLYERYLEIKLNPGVTQHQLAQRFGIKENVVRISIFLMNEKLEPYGLVIRSRHHGYHIKELKR